MTGNKVRSPTSSRFEFLPVAASWKLHLTEHDSAPDRSAFAFLLLGSTNFPEVQR